MRSFSIGAACAVPFPVPVVVVAGAVAENDRQTGDVLTKDVFALDMSSGHGAGRGHMDVCSRTTRYCQQLPM